MARPNLYQFVENNPINYLDPNGLFTIGIGSQIGGAILFQAEGGFSPTLSINGCNPLDWRLGAAFNIKPLTSFSTSIGGAAGITACYSPAKKPEEWNGWSGTGGFSFGEPVVFGADVSNIHVGTYSPLVYSGFIGGGLDVGIIGGLPAEAHFGAGYTKAFSLSPREVWHGIIDIFR